MGANFLARSEHKPAQFEDEHGIAMGFGHDLLGAIVQGSVRPTEHAQGKIVGMIVVESLDRHKTQIAIRVAHGIRIEQGVEQRAAFGFIATVGADEQQLGRQGVVNQLGQERSAIQIAPLQVVDDQYQG